MKIVPQKSWLIMRLLLVSAACLSWYYRATYLWDHYSDAGIVVTSGNIAITRWFTLSPSAVTLIWFFMALSLMILLSDRFFKIGAVLYLFCAILLFGSEGLNMKAYDRLLMWQTFVLIFSPRTEKTWSGIPVGKIMMLLVYCGIYGSTGWMKALWNFHGWASGETLTYHLLDFHFGNKPLGLWMAQFRVLTVFMSWLTLLFEALFPFLIWVRVLNPILLAVGIAFHAGIAITMNVGVFFYASIVGYPVMLHPYYAGRLKDWISRKSFNTERALKICKIILFLCLIVLFFIPFSVNPGLEPT